MRRHKLFVVSALLLILTLTAPVQAQRNGTEVAVAATKVAVVMAGDFYEDTGARLEALGYTVDYITIEDLAKPIMLRLRYAVVYFSTNWAGIESTYDSIEQHARSIKIYVFLGGGLAIEQPNPYNLPGQTCTPTILPWPITFEPWYDAEDYSYIVDPTHYITEGLSDEDMPFAADDVTSYSTKYTVLARSTYDDNPTLLVASFGLGRITVHTGCTNPSSIHPLPDVTLDRIVGWTARAD